MTMNQKTKMDVTKQDLSTPNHNKKRKKDGTLISSTDDDRISVRDTQPNKEVFADENREFSRFLVITANNHEPIKYSIFAIQKFLKCAVGDVSCARKLANGSILLEVATKNQEKNALAMKMWVDVPITVTPHRSLNSSRGVIRCREFRDCEDDEVLEALRTQGITHVKHIMTKRNGKIEPTNTFIVTFNTPVPPKSIKAAYMNIKVDLYIPNPLRCYQCQRFGHGKNACKRNATCAKCGQEGHDDATCEAPLHCANCLGPHAAFSKDCPTWSKQREITQIKFERNISFFDARQIVEQRNRGSQNTASGPNTTRPGVTYAHACVQTVSASTQTDLTWPQRSKLPIAVPNAAPRKQTSNSQSQTVNTPSPTKESTGGNPQPNQPPSKGKHAQTKKPGPASYKTAPNKGKGANDPVGQFNRFGNLEDDGGGDDDDGNSEEMDYQVIRSKSSSPKKKINK